MKKLFYFFVFSLLLNIITNAATIEGTVTDSTTGKPILGVNIIFATNPESSIPIGNNYSTYTDSSGYYSIPDVKPGIYHILIEHKKYQPYYPEKLLIPDSSNTVIDFSFKLIPNEIFPPVKVGIISGRVTYDSSNGSPVLGAYITAIPASKEVFIEPWLGDFAVTDSGGYYSFRVPEGSYKVLCYVYNYYRGYYQEYYDNTANPEEAKIVDVSENSETSGIDFGIPKFDEDSVVISISGKVTDDKGNPVPKAFVRVEFPDIYTFRYDPMLDLAATTDENGKYLISFPLYKAFFAKNCIIYVKNEGYEVEFFKEKKNYHEANRLYFDSTITFENIDFTLEPYVPELYSISGTVTGDNGIPVQSAMIIGMNAESNQYYYSISDSLGSYTIPNLPVGKYYVLFIAKWYVPEFYNNALKWEDAFTIGVTENRYGIDASLTRIEELPVDSSLVIITGCIKSVDNIPLPGVLVTATNSNDIVAAYDITDSDGNFKIEGLAKGGYNVQASLMNYDSKSESITVSSSRSAQIINFSMDPAAVTSVEEKPNLVPERLELYPNHPNPFNPSTIITFTLPGTQNVTLKVYNIIGQEVATLVNGRLNAGTYRIPFDAKGLGSGVYLYQLKTGSTSIVKKMLLTK